MSLFSKLIRKNNNHAEIEKDVVNIDNVAEIPLEMEVLAVPTQELLDIATKLERYTHYKLLGSELRTLANDATTQISTYFKLMNDIKLQRDIQNKKTQNSQEVESVYNKAKNITDERFNARFTDFVEFYLDFKRITIEFEILEVLKKCSPNIFLDASLAELYSNYEILSTAFSEATRLSKSLKQQQDELSSEIEKYSITVNECKQKYRLSIDWGGKKSFLVSLGKKLSERRNVLVEKERLLNEDLQVLYAEYPRIQDSFNEYFTYLVHCLEKLLTSYKQSTDESKEIEDILVNLEQELKKM